MLKDIDSHLKEGRKKECSQKCGQLFSTEEEMKTHIKEECFQTVTKCIGCSYSSKRGEVNIHQEICEEMEKIKQFRLPLENKSEQQNKKIKKQEEKIALFTKYFEELLKKDEKKFVLSGKIFKFLYY